MEVGAGHEPQALRITKGKAQMLFQTRTRAPKRSKHAGTSEGYGEVLINDITPLGASTFA